LKKIEEGEFFPSSNTSKVQLKAGHILGYMALYQLFSVEVFVPLEVM